MPTTPPAAVTGVLHDNLILTGFGIAIPPHKVTTEDLASTQGNGWLDPFDGDRIAAKPEYHRYAERKRAAGEEPLPLGWFIEELMGFKDRYHVTPFPPTRRDMPEFAATELAVQAVVEALADARISPDEVDAWFVATMSNPVKAPGMACLVKDYFLGKGKRSPTFSLTSGCSGFNLALHQAYCFMRVHLNVKHVVVCHTDVISRFLVDSTNVVPLATFGDGAGAVVLSRQSGARKEGLLDFHTLQEPAFLETIAFRDNWSLDYSPADIRGLAVSGITETAANLFKHGITVDRLVPHQTGNLIIDTVARQMGIPEDKVFKAVQRAYGNVSGATVPVSLHWLSRAGDLKPGETVLCASAGVGGEFNAFAYINPERQPRDYRDYRPLEGKVVLVTGSTGGIGAHLVAELVALGARVLALHRNQAKFEQLGFPAEVVSLEGDITSREYVAAVADYVAVHGLQLHGVIHCANHLSAPADMSPQTGEDLAQAHQTNAQAPANLTLTLRPFIKGHVIYLGSALEEKTLSGWSAHTASRLALRAFALSVAPEFEKAGVRSTYYIAGLVDDGVSDRLTTRQKNDILRLIGQKAALRPADLAKRIAHGLVANRTLGTRDQWEHSLLIRKDGFDAGH